MRHPLRPACEVARVSAQVQCLYSERLLNVGCRPKESDLDPWPLRSGLNWHRCLQVPLQLSQQAGIELDSLRVRANVSPTVETARQHLEAILFECFQVSQGNLRLVANLLECETPSGTGAPQQFTNSDMLLGSLGVKLGPVGSEVGETCSHCRVPSCKGAGSAAPWANCLVRAQDLSVQNETTCAGLRISEALNVDPLTSIFASSRITRDRIRVESNSGADREFR